MHPPGFWDTVGAFFKGIQVRTPKVAGSNPATATNQIKGLRRK